MKADRSGAFPRGLGEGSRGILRSLALAGILLVSAPDAVRAAPDSLGTDFWVTFMKNEPVPAASNSYFLYVSGPVATSGMVEIPGLGFTAPFTVSPGVVTSIPLPAGVMVTAADTDVDRGIHITALAEVAVYGLNQRPSSTDGFCALPTDILGNDHLLLAYRVATGFTPSYPSALAVVATQDGTSVTLTPSVAAGPHPAGVPYSVALDRGEVYFLTTTAGGGLNGTRIGANLPVALFGGHECAHVPTTYDYCDHLVEQIPPLSVWGRSFATMPLAFRLNGDTFVFLASQDGTQVRVNGALVATLNTGQVHERIIVGPAWITATEPILVSQYSNGTFYDNVVSDPFMMLITPYEQFLADYTVSTPASGFANNFLNLVVPAAGVGGILLDGSPIPAGGFTPIGTSGFSGIQLPVALGSHTLGGSLPFGVSVYGFDVANSYGYPGGFSLAQVANVESLQLTPPNATLLAGTPHCLTATVLDALMAPIPDIRVDFGVGGANTGAGFGYTDASGAATFCYTGTAPGLDTVQASVGPLAASAAVSWFQYTPTPTRTATPACPVKAWPNPYVPDHAFGGTMKMDCLDAGDRVVLYTLSGEKVREMASAGFRLEWDGRNEEGSPVVTGVYYYSVERAGAVVATGKFLLLREGAP